MAHRRAMRVGDLLKEEISDIIRNEMKDPRIGFVTVSAVEVTDDLRFARVFVSVLGSDEESVNTLKGLESAGGFIRGILGRRIRLRYTPELSFRLDESYRHAARIAEVMRTLHDAPREPDVETPVQSIPPVDPVEDTNHG